MTRTESLEGLLSSFHFGMTSSCLGSSFMYWGYSFAKLNEPTCEGLSQSFIPFANCMMKKVMYYRGNPKQQMLLKGHFVTNAGTLEQRYSKENFFVVIRNPIDRIPSFINLMKVLLEDGPGKWKHGLFPATWKVIRDYSLCTQIPYCEQEMSFYKEQQIKNGYSIYHICEQLMCYILFNVFTLFVAC